jgi:hypothetical protein
LAEGCLTIWLSINRASSTAQLLFFAPQFLSIPPNPAIRRSKQIDFVISARFLRIQSLMNSTIDHAPNLTQRPPRSPRVRLGGYVLLARIVDKGRADVAGTAGQYKYNNPMDHHFFRFTGLTAESLRRELEAGKGDGEIVEWVAQNSPNKHTPWEIHQWSSYLNERGPDGDTETLEFFAKRVGDISKTREDVRTWFDYPDLDDHVTFGGKP